MSGFLDGCNIACVGAGPASLYFALLAKQTADCRVTVFERNARGAAPGWGVILHLDAMAESDPLTAQALREQAFAWQDTTVHIAGTPAVVVPTPGTSIGRGALTDTLLRRVEALGCTVRFGTEIADRWQLAGYDLVVAADGVRSRLRDAQRSAFGTTSSMGSNRFTWLGTSRVFDSFTFAFVKTRAGWLWAHAYGFNGSTSTFIVETSADTFRELGFEHMTAERTLRQLESSFEPWLEGHPLWSQPGTRDTSIWQRFQTVTNPIWHDGQVALMGDAAHTTHFTIGSGTQLAFADAMSLAAQLRSHRELKSALSAYQTERLAGLRTLQLEAGNSATWFEHLARYIDRDAAAFTELLYARRSSLLQRVPPALYLWACHVSQRHPRLLGERLRLVPRLLARTRAARDAQ